MSFMDKLGAAAGLGAAEVSVSTLESVYHWGDAARGTLGLRGGSVEQRVTRITVAAMERWETRDSDGDRREEYRDHHETQVAGESLLAPGAAAQHPFEVQIPDGADLEHEWYIHVRVHVAGGADRHAYSGFRLLPPPAILGLSAALGEVAPFRQQYLGNARRQVIMDFAPPDHLKDKLDGVKLLVTEDGGAVHGILEINPQEHSLVDHLKALVQADRIKREIRFPAESLAAAPEGPAPLEVVQALRELLQGYVG